MNERLLDDLKATASRLENVANAYARDQGEDNIVRLAGCALLFIDQAGQIQRFTQFVRDHTVPLNDEQRAHLKRFGLEE